MNIKEITKSVGHNGRLCIDLPEMAGKKVKFFYYPVENAEGKAAVNEDKKHYDFVAASYLAAVEDNDEEDAVWEEYLK